ncbi:hypothetical protein BDF22DRAFT_657239 [Syncephalis plumigaleata]|nr:hypothetical protein BDF22DRAFT_657239 [Syncephalis plumigaleata]
MSSTFAYKGKVDESIYYTCMNMMANTASSSYEVSASTLDDSIPLTALPMSTNGDTVNNNNNSDDEEHAIRKHNDIHDTTKHYLSYNGNSNISNHTVSTTVMNQMATTSTIPRKRARGERVPWLPEEDNLLRLAVQLYGYNTDKWTKISACVPGRTNKHCRKRWFHSLDPSRRKGSWTQKEDLLLREAHARFGEQWSRVAELVPGRTDDQCSKRWRESLDPAIDRSEWTEAEDQDLLRLVGELGSQWQRIAEHFPGRPGLHCRNRWRKLCRNINPFKRFRQGKDVPDAAAIITGINLKLPMNNDGNSIPEDAHISLADGTSTLLNSNQWLALMEEDNMDDADTYEQDNDSSSDMNDINEVDETSQTGKIATHGLLDMTTGSSSHVHDHTSSGNTANASLAVRMENGSGRTTSRTTKGEGHTISMEAYGCAYPECNAVFTAPHALLYHFKRCHTGQTAPLERPFRCAMPGCLKRYKNLNGIQYHVERAKGSVGHTYSMVGPTSTNADSNTTSSAQQCDAVSNSTLDATNATNATLNVIPVSGGGGPVTDTTGAGLVEERKPFRCAVPGCPKAYRNPNGLEYHMRHAHLDLMPASLVDEMTARRPRPFRCTAKGCGRRYMSPNGLHYHICNMHPEQEDELLHSLRSQSAAQQEQNEKTTSPALQHNNDGAPVVVWPQEDDSMTRSSTSASSSSNVT